MTEHERQRFPDDPAEQYVLRNMYGDFGVSSRRDLRRHNLTSVFTDARLEYLNAKERRAVGDSFGAAVSELNRGIRDARGTRFRTLDDQRYVVRTLPSSWSSMMTRPPTTMTLEISGWAHGEVLRGNDVWFQLARPWGGWVHSGEFRPEDRDVSGLRENTDVQLPRYKHPETCTCDTCLPVKNTLKYELERKHSNNPFASAFESALTPTAEKARKVRNPYADEPARPRKSVRKMEHSVEREREIQAAMAYRVGPHPWFGWRVVADRHDGGTHTFWRPTEDSAHKTGHKALERFVKRRQRLYDAANPKLVTARDRWIIMPTQAEQTAKEQAEWDAQFNEKGK